MLIAFELSGEHETLPKAEALACLRAHNIRYEEKEHTDGILVIEAEEGTLAASTSMAEIAERLGMTHRVYAILGVSSRYRCIDEREMEALIKDAVDIVMEPGDTFAVRVRMKSKSAIAQMQVQMQMQRGYQHKELEREVGALIKRMGYEVDLKKPKKTFVLLFTRHKCFLALLLHSIEKKRYEQRKPHLRPFFSPGVIMPKLARVLVNLSAVKAEDILLDPFCGTGGILIEAGMVGATPIGMDIQAKMVRGASQNLLFYHLKGHLITADATDIPLRVNSVDAVVTDLPYGRVSLISGDINAKSRASFIERLYEEAIGEIYTVLKRGRKAVIVFNSPTLYSLFSNWEFKFNILERHEYRVHRSLIRYIAVLEK